MGDTHSAMSDPPVYKIELGGQGGGKVSFTMNDPEYVERWKAVAAGESNRASWSEEEEGGTEVVICLGDTAIGSSVNVYSSFQTKLVHASFCISPKLARQLSICLSQRIEIE